MSLQPFKTPRWSTWQVGVLVLLVGGAVNLAVLMHQRWQNTRADYCITQPQKLLGGRLGEVPAGYTQYCEDNSAVRQEVQHQRLQVEWLRTPGKNLTGLWETLRERGLGIKTQDALDDHVFLSLMLHQGRVVEYQAIFDGRETTITLSGTP